MPVDRTEEFSWAADYPQNQHPHNPFHAAPINQNQPPINQNHPQPTNQNFFASLGRRQSTVGGSKSGDFELQQIPSASGDASPSPNPTDLTGRPFISGFQLQVRCEFIFVFFWFIFVFLRLFCHYFATILPLFWDLPGVPSIARILEHLRFPFDFHLISI